MLLTLILILFWLVVAGVAIRLTIELIVKIRALVDRLSRRR